MLLKINLIRVKEEEEVNANMIGVKEEKEVIANMIGVKEEKEVIAFQTENKFNNNNNMGEDVLT
jgi:hypothetical protein